MTLEFYSISEWYQLSRSLTVFALLRVASLVYATGWLFSYGVRFGINAIGSTRPSTRWQPKLLNLYMSQKPSFFRGLGLFGVLIGMFVASPFRHASWEKKKRLRIR